MSDTEATNKTVIETGDVAETVIGEDTSLSVDFDGDETPEAASTETASEDGDTADAAKEEDTSASEDLPDLGEWDSSNEETRAAFDARYFTEAADGAPVLNEEALSREYWKSFEANAGDVEKASLNEATYAYLKDTLGVDRATAKKLERALVAGHREAQLSVYQRVGGETRYKAAMEFAGKSYTQDQKARLDAALKDGGDAADDALDALMARYDRANPTADAPKPKRLGPPGARRPSSPQRDVTAAGGAGGSGSAGFDSPEAYQEAFNEANSKDDGGKAAMKVRGRYLKSSPDVRAAIRAMTA